MLNSRKLPSGKFVIERDDIDIEIILYPDYLRALVDDVTKAMESAGLMEKFRLKVPTAEELKQRAARKEERVKANATKAAEHKKQKEAHEAKKKEVEKKTAETKKDTAAKKEAKTIKAKAEKKDAPAEHKAEHAHEHVAKEDKK